VRVCVRANMHRVLYMYGHDCFERCSYSCEVRWSVLECVLEYVLQCVAVCCSVLQYETQLIFLQDQMECVGECVAVCVTVCVAVFCSVLQCEIQLVFLLGLYLLHVFIYTYGYISTRVWIYIHI